MSDEAGVTIRELGPGDEELVLSGAAALFDDPPDPSATRAFLADDRHHLLVVFVDERPAGFASAVELLHPDKPRPELFVYEVQVDGAFRGRGLGRSLLQRLVVLAREHGCGDMFVLTEESNTAGVRLYEGGGGSRYAGQLMFTWEWPEAKPAGGPQR